MQRARNAASQARQAADARAQRDKLRETLAREMFARPVRDYAHRNAGRPVRVLRAGFLASPDELGLSQLRDLGYAITVVTVDQAGPGSPVPAPAGDVRLGDLRAVPIPPRSFDIVHCALLLDRIRHVELVLDRLIAALRPGGFLMLRIRDRECAIGLLDRRLPRPARRLLRARLDFGDAPAAGLPGDPWLGACRGAGPCRRFPRCTRRPARTAGSRSTRGCAGWSSRSVRPRRPGPTAPTGWPGP